MHPDLESFLDQAFQNIRPTSSGIGRVVVEPDYDVEPSAADAAGLRSELLDILTKQSLDTEIRSREGLTIAVPESYGVLRKYLRTVTLHHDKLDGSWVEVAPPGNWI